MFFTVTINGKKVGSVENKDPRTFKDVKVFAGDNFHPAADATYRNLVWENLQLPPRIVKLCDVKT